MSGLENYLTKNLHTLRRVVQVTIVGFIFLIPVMNVLGKNFVLGTFYSISLGNLEITDPALVLQTVLLTKELPFSLFLSALIPVVLAILLGKVFCGWACPYNFMAEFGDKLRRKLRPPSTRFHNRNPKSGYYWLIFTVIVMITAVFGFPLITLISLPGLISAQIGDAIFLGSVGIELSLVAVILLVEIFFAPRFWCRFACPVGAALALARIKSTLRVNFVAEKCTCSERKRPCNAACPIELDPRSPGIYPYCYNCGECVIACRSEGRALTFTVQPPEKNHRKYNTQIID